MNQQLQIEVEGRSVEGRFTHRSERAIEVEITSPYGGFTKQLELFSFSQKTAPDGMKGVEGIRRGRNC